MLAERNDLDGALEKAQIGVALTEGVDLAFFGFSNLGLTRVLFSSGDLDGAFAVTQKIAKIAQDHELPFTIFNQMAAWQVRIRLAQGRPEAAAPWLAEHGLDGAEEPAIEHDFDLMVFARILVVQGREDEAVNLLQSMREAAEKGGRMSRVIEILVLQVLAYQAQGNQAKAMAALGDALVIAAPEGFVRVFVDEGPPMARLLYKALSQDMAPAYVSRLLAAFPEPEPEQASIAEAQPDQSGLIEPLSEREIEVLQLIAEGLTNREIAARLYLSLHTIKAHTRNIYGKLGVSNRTQASSKANTLGLIAQ
jgi:LuxR family maltose regulon positive regulatory protein